jgi:hypothetical protein
VVIDPLVSFFLFLGKCFPEVVGLVQKVMEKIMADTLPDRHDEPMILGPVDRGAVLPAPLEHARKDFLVVTAEGPLETVAVFRIGFLDA